MQRSSLLCLVSAFAAACGPFESSTAMKTTAGSAVELYENCGFNGSHWFLQQDAASIPFALSSFRLQTGKQITLYSGENFTGDSITKTGDDDCLVDDAWNDRARSLRVTAVGNAPLSWQEHWFEHRQLVQRVYADADTAIYFDANMDRRSTTWIYKMVGDAWRYTKRAYGSFGPDGQLYAIFHQNNYGGGHPSYYYAASHDYRNTIDLATNASWSNPSGWTVEATIHEIGHIVESASHGLRSSPAFGLWGDSKWCEIFVYDVLRNIGMTNEADRVLRQFSQASATYPRVQSFWFRDWYLPIYQTYGGVVVLNRFFEILARSWPANQPLNWGAYVHFMSAAAGADVQPIANRAFGWTAEWEQQRQDAQRRFPLNYKKAP